MADRKKRARAADPSALSEDEEDELAELKRLRKENLELRTDRENPRVRLLVDRYDEDWSALWWARAEGVARLRDVAGRGAAAGLAALRRKYPSTRTWSFGDR